MDTFKSFLLVQNQFTHFGAFFHRACRCWNEYRKGDCADKLSNYIGEKADKPKAKKERHYQYFLRTDRDGRPLGDTSNSKGFDADFIYDFDETCYNSFDPRT